VNGRSAAIIGAIALIGVGALLIGIVGGKESAPARAGKTTDHRVKEGPYVASEKALSDAEDLRIVVVPSALGAALDVKCLIYRNREMNQVVFTCPDVRQDDISLPELDRPR